VNGWWRDTAQRLLVLKQDKSVVPALEQLTRNAPSLVGRFHAMWTLEGLGAFDAALARELMKDPAPRMRVQAIRASETLYKAGDRTFLSDYRAMAGDADAAVAIQAMLTLNLFKAPDVANVIRGAQAANTARGVKVIGDLILNPPAAGRGGRGGGAANAAAQQVLERGAAIYTELCYSCHGDDGRGQPLAGAPAGTLMAPSLAGSPRVNGHRDYVINALLHGMTGPISGVSYSQIMVPMGANSDEWVASIASYVRSSFGNNAGVVNAADVARVRAATSGRSTPWTVADLEARLPRHLDPQTTWNVTASHNAAAAIGALTMRGWNTGAPQTPGMWFQVELPQPVTLAEIQFDVPAGRGVTGPAIPYPRAYKVEVSLNGTSWGTPVAEGTGAPGRTFVSFTPVRAKFVRISQTDASPGAPAWVLTNVRLYEAQAGR
jgi:mono/diheme cytochrome c family protein